MTRAQTVKEPLLYAIVARLIAASRLFARLQNSYEISTLGFAQTHQRISPTRFHRRWEHYRVPNL